MIDRQAEERLTFFELKKIAKMLRYTLTDDQIEEIITRVAGKGQREISWQQFNDYLDRHVNKKNSRFE